MSETDADTIHINESCVYMLIKMACQDDQDSVGRSEGEDTFGYN